MDCGGANLNSIKYSIDRLGLRSVISNEGSVLERSDKLIVPGVGAADIVMNQLKDKGLDILLKAYKGPILGICVGMQVLFEHSEEGETNCLGLLKGNVIKLKGSAEFPIPHMGWNYAKRTRIPRGNPTYLTVLFLNVQYCPIAKSAERYYTVLLNTAQYGTNNQLIGVH